MKILKDIKEFTKNWKLAIKERLAACSRQAKLIILQVGNNPASTRYVRNKVKDCEEVGISATVINCPEDFTTEQLCETVALQQTQCDAIIVQLPLPAHIDLEKVKSVIDPKKDIDGFTAISAFKACTPLGIMIYLAHCGFKFKGANVVILGRSELVGKPLAEMMTNAHATVTLCHSATKNVWDFINSADLIVSAVGKANFLNCYAIWCPVVDVGINFTEDGKMVGDCYNTEGREVTPVPGGVGLLTRCALLEQICMSLEHMEVPSSVQTRNSSRPIET